MGNSITSQAHPVGIVGIEGIIAQPSKFGKINQITDTNPITTNTENIDVQGFQSYKLKYETNNLQINESKLRDCYITDKSINPTCIKDNIRTLKPNTNNTEIDNIELYGEGHKLRTKTNETIIQQPGSWGSPAKILSHNKNVFADIIPPPSIPIASPCMAKISQMDTFNNVNLKIKYFNNNFTLMTLLILIFLLILLKQKN